MLRRVATFARMAKKKGAKTTKAAVNNGELGAGPLNMSCFQLMAKDEVPKALPDEEYPDWMWKLAEPRMTITDLETNYDNLSMDELVQYFRWKRREQLRETNADSLRF
mmetsp:Transcript_11920/g.16505  ORF Transcript_11920/g.16505 Transcript_11920/m.16505 type:complete len:108 (-) Transcript_11920:507-830(-)